MADKTPVRVVFNASNVATGMAEFQSGETVPVANGGTGISSIGSAGQIIKVNAAGNALEFGAEGDVSITNLIAPTNADLTFQTSGTGNIVLDAVTVNGTTFSAADSTKITIAEALDVTGALTSSGLSYPTSDGSVGQFLKTDGSGTLSFADLSLGDLTIIGSTISAPSNADLSLQPGGTGDVLLSALRINGTTLDSADSTKITIAEAVDVTGALTFSGLSLPTSDGTIGQFLKTDGSGNLSFATVSVGDFTFVGSTMGSPSNADITLDPSGSGDIQLKANTVVTGTMTTTGNVLLGEDATIIFEGASDSTNETTLTVVDPTADRTLNLPNKSGTLATTDDTAFPNSTTPTHPAASGDADLGSNLTDSITDAFGVPSADFYDHMEPRGSTVTVDLGAFS